jgi:hypothetical protein
MFSGILTRWGSEAYVLVIKPERQMAKTVVLVNGNPIRIDTDSPTSTDWLIWLSAFAITVVGNGGFMGICIWLMG